MGPVHTAMLCGAEKCSMSEAVPCVTAQQCLYGDLNQVSLCNTANKVGKIKGGHPPVFSMRFCVRSGKG